MDMHESSDITEPSQKRQKLNDYWIGTTRYAQTDNGSMIKMCKFGKWWAQEGEEKVTCSEAALNSSMFCKYHETGNFQISNEHFISAETGLYAFGIPKKGDLKYEGNYLYKYDSKKWRTCCKVCDAQARKDGYCRTHDPRNMNANTNRGYSKIACDFFDQLSHELNISITHVHIGADGHATEKNEFKIPNTKFSVDGYHAESKTVYEFLGNYYHGNPDMHPAEEYNKTLKKNHGQIHKETFERLKEIKSQGFTVYYIWEKDFRTFLAANVDGILKLSSKLQTID